MSNQNYIEASHLTRCPIVTTILNYILTLLVMNFARLGKTRKIRLNGFITQSRSAGLFT